MECLTVNSIRRIINLEWKLKVKKIFPDSTSPESHNPFEIPEKTICSALCEAKGMEDLNFYLEITSQLNLLAKGHGRWSYQLIHAFAVVKDRAYLVRKTTKLKFLDFLKRDHLASVEEVTFYCMVLIGQPAAHSTLIETDLVGSDEGIPAEGQVCADLENISSPHCGFDGEIPDFTVDRAKELLIKDGSDNVLKILAMEYLIKSIQAENVSDILKVAIDQDLKVLQKLCSDYLSGCKIKRNNSYSDESSEISSASSLDPIIENAPIYYSVY